MMDLDRCRRLVSEATASHAAAKATLAAAVREREEACTATDEAGEAQRILQAVAQAVQQEVHTRIACVVSRCLAAVFDDPYEFRIAFDQKRGRTEARLILERRGVEFDDPVNQVGGGVVDVAALALRLACLMLARPLARRLLVLDEPFKNVRGAAYKARVRDMLTGLAEELGVQFILNIDLDVYPEFALGTVVRLGGE